MGVESLLFHMAHQLFTLPQLLLFCVVTCLYILHLSILLLFEVGLDMKKLSHLVKSLCSNSMS